MIRFGFDIGIFTAALGMHFMSCSLVSVLATLLPIWMAIHLNRGKETCHHDVIIYSYSSSRPPTLPSHSSGGLGYSVKDCAMVLSTAGVFIFVIQSHVAHRVKLSLRAFPVRTFRYQTHTSPSQVYGSDYVCFCAGWVSGP